MIGIQIPFVNKLFVNVRNPDQSEWHDYQRDQDQDPYLPLFLVLISHLNLIINFINLLPLAEMV